MSCDRMSAVVVMAAAPLDARYLSAHALCNYNHYTPSRDTTLNLRLTFLSPRVQWYRRDLLRGVKLLDVEAEEFVLDGAL
jgi:hypothetical protein